MYAALSCSAEGSHAAAALQQLQQQNPADQQHAGQASVVAAAAPGNNSTGSFAVALRSSAAASGLISCSRAALTHSGGGAAAAGVCSSSRGGGSSSSSTFRSAYRDFVPAADQSKQDEVFIGGLPSHWKAQQVGSGLRGQAVAAVNRGPYILGYRKCDVDCRADSLSGQVLAAVKTEAGCPAEMRVIFYALSIQGQNNTCTHIWSMRRHCLCWDDESHPVTAPQP